MEELSEVNDADTMKEVSASVHWGNTYHPVLFLWWMVNTSLWELKRGGEAKVESYINGVGAAKHVAFTGLAIFNLDVSNSHL